MAENDDFSIKGAAQELSPPEGSSQDQHGRPVEEVSEGSTTSGSVLCPPSRTHVLYWHREDLRQAVVTPSDSGTRSTRGQN